MQDPHRKDNARAGDSGGTAERRARSNGYYSTFGPKRQAPTALILGPMYFTATRLDLGTLACNLLKLADRWEEHTR